MSQVVLLYWIKLDQVICFIKDLGHLFCFIFFSYEEVYEVSSEVTFEYYNNELIEYDDALNDRSSPAYDWWKNIILPVVSKDVSKCKTPFWTKIQARNPS